MDLQKKSVTDVYFLSGISKNTIFVATTNIYAITC